MEIGKAATLQAYRNWLANDAVFVKRVQSLHKLDENFWSYFATTYQIVRTLRHQGNVPGTGAKRLWDLIASRLCDWPLDLVSRATMCAEIAEHFVSSAPGDLKCRTPYSATSKMIWFARPDGWTMFDRLAADALQIPNTGGRGRMIAFYQTLSRADFGRRIDKLNKAVREAELELPAERIYDAALWLRGKHAFEPEAFDLLAFECALPSNTQRKLHLIGNVATAELA